MLNPTVLLVNRARTTLGVTEEALARALQRYVDEALAPVWRTPCRLEVARDLRPGCWGLVFLEDADESHLLGYHDLTPDGLPLSKVFVQPTLADGQKVSVTASHELAEMLVDPAINLLVHVDARTTYAYEVCDPVEGLELEIDGVALNDFVYPAWFEGFRPPGSARFDHLGKLTAPFQIHAGGYMPTFAGGKWSNVFGSVATEQHHRRRDPRGHRRERRGRPHVRSTLSGR